MPFARKRTATTRPSASDATAASVTGVPAFTEVPATGAVRPTVGGVLPATVSTSGSELADTPALSVATATSR